MVIPPLMCRFTTDATNATEVILKRTRATLAPEINDFLLNGGYIDENDGTDGNPLPNKEELQKKAKIFLSSKFNVWKFSIKNLYKRLLG